jgi:pimeloyl-ACP methyl ester carboxylesterase
VPFFTSQDGVKLYYEVEGSGPPVVFHLGAGADIELWRQAGYVGPLSKSHTCVLFDHRGHGKSDHPTSVEANHIDRYADDVIRLVQHLGLSEALFLGWSNAIHVGLRAAQRRPDMFGSLVLLGGMGRPRPMAKIEEATRRRVAEIRQKGWWSILEPMSAAEKLPVPRWFLDSVVATDLEPWIAYTEARLLWNWEPWDALPAIVAPTLFMAGELEDPEDVMAEVAAAMPHATRVRIPDREHINAFLYSEFVVPRVLEFFAARSPQATG